MFKKDKKNNLEGSSVPPQLLSSSPVNQDISSNPIVKKGKTGLIAGVSVLVLIGILGGGYFAHSKGYITIPFLPSNSDNVLKEMVRKMSEVESADYSIALNLTEQISEQTEQKSEWDLSLSGVFDLTSSENKGLQTEFSGKTKDSSMEEVTFGGEIRALKEALYLKLSDVSLLPFPEIFSDMKDKWYRLEMNNENQESLNSNLNLNLPSSSLTDEQINQLRQLAQDSSFFKEVEKLDNEKIQNVDYYHYRLMLDPEGVKKFIELTTEITGQSYLTDNQDRLNQVLENLDSLTGEVWIGKDDHYLYRLKLSDTLETDAIEERSLVSLDAQFSRFNEPQEITAPQESEELKIDEIIQEIFGSLMVADSAIEDLEKDSDEDGLSDYLEELFYETDPNKKDTDEDGYSDGEEVLNGYNPNGAGKLNLTTSLLDS